MRVPNVPAFLAAVVLPLTTSLVPILAFPTIRVRLKVAQMLIRAVGVIALAVEFKRAQDSMRFQTRRAPPIRRR